MFAEKYHTRLVVNARTKRFLGTHHPEFPKQFETIIEVSSLEG
jgi:hypothetical protein